MARLKPLSPDTTPELKPHFDFFLGTLGFTPNSVLTMQRRPRIVQAFAQLNGAVMDPAGEVELGFRRLVGHLAQSFLEMKRSAQHLAASKKVAGNGQRVVRISSRENIERF